MLELLRVNVARNQGVVGDVDVVVEDVDLRQHRTKLTSHCASLVLCNPPYFPLGQRRVSQHEERADAVGEMDRDSAVPDRGNEAAERQREIGDGQPGVGVAHRGPD